MEVLLRTIRSPCDDDIIQRAFRKIVAKLHCYDSELQKWSVQTIARVAKGVSRLRDYSSEKFIAQLAEIIWRSAMMMKVVWNHDFISNMPPSDRVK
ncbi:MAG: hypothetical protein QS748_06280 [Candidatus Endonucleobacter bathymodioli]|uniref:Uncharacterized protein n=1 Tax=Candidatus Endonucleibacter bathymodioli TaxID=539814 RepID=A0AA90SSQ8_9GAMM|nr:hypothetical protein [Candidatus Endonucleobacter bathymodioli]